jgi:hypothetical protein
MSKKYEASFMRGWSELAGPETTPETARHSGSLNGAEFATATGHEISRAGEHLSSRS